MAATLVAAICGGEPCMAMAGSVQDNIRQHKQSDGVLTCQPYHLVMVVQFGDQLWSDERSIHVICGVL